jgi:hypothetical protein
MHIRKTAVAKLIEAGTAIDKLSRKKLLTSEEAGKASADAIRFVRSVLTTLRKLK